MYKNDTCIEGPFSNCTAEITILLNEITILLNKMIHIAFYTYKNDRAADSIVSCTITFSSVGILYKTPL